MVSFGRFCDNLFLIDLRFFTFLIWKAEAAPGCDSLQMTKAQAARLLLETNHTTAPYPNHWETICGECVPSKAAIYAFIFFRSWTSDHPLQSRSYAAGGARYLQADLMLLTHAGTIFIKEPRGRFGIFTSVILAGASHGTKHRPGSEIR